jgi:hypothetical protein
MLKLTALVALGGMIMGATPASTVGSQLAQPGVMLESPRFERCLYDLGCERSPKGYW